MRREYPALPQNRLLCDELPTHAFLHAGGSGNDTMHGGKGVDSNFYGTEMSTGPVSPLHIFPHPTALELLPPSALSCCPFSHPWRVEPGG